MITGVEIKRKIVHMSSLAIPAGYLLFSGKTVISILVPLFLAFLLVDLLRQYHAGTSRLFKKFFVGTILREKESNSLMGSTYFLFSSVLVVFFFPKSIAIASLLILILSDTAAALVGKGIGKVPIFRRKTLEGSLAFFVSSQLIVWIYPGLNHLWGALGALAATLIEALPVKVDDNLTIPLIAGAIMFFGMG
jgi:dolichol kinase